MVLPVWRTTPAPLLHHAAGVPPAQILLDHLVRKAAIRLNRLDKRHILQRQLTAKGPQARLRALAGVVPFAIEKSDPLHRGLALPPPFPPPHPLQGECKEAKASAFRQWAATRDQGDLWVYSDGSKTDQGTGGGWCVLYKGARC